MQADKPLLSVLIPALNAEKYIALTLKSILQQTYTNIEVIVCDDGSSDKTSEVVKSIRDPRLTFYQNPVNKGKIVTCNAMLEKTRGPYVNIHDADDISLPDRFEKQMSFLVQHPDYAMCGTNFTSFLDGGKIIDRSDLETDPAAIHEKIKKESQLHGPTVIFRKDVFSTVGGFYRYFNLGDDIDLTMRVAEKYNSINLPQHLYLYRHVTTSLTNNIHGYSIERWGHAKLLYFLAEERKNNNGIDSIMRNDHETINAAMKEFTREYEKDPTIALRRGTFRLLGMKMFKNAVHLSWTAMRREFSELNIKCFIYACLFSAYGLVKLAMSNEKVNLSFLDDNGKSIKS